MSLNTWSACEDSGIELVTWSAQRPNCSQPLKAWSQRSLGDEALLTFTSLGQACFSYPVGPNTQIVHHANLVVRAKLCCLSITLFLSSCFFFHSCSLMRCLHFMLFIYISTPKFRSMCSPTVVIQMQGCL